jgi:hypothetical protein
MTPDEKEFMTPDETHTITLTIDINHLYNVVEFKEASIALAFPATAPINASPSSMSPLENQLESNQVKLLECFIVKTMQQKSYLSIARSALTTSRNISRDHLRSLSRKNSSTKIEVP